jgi:hypothetical protein
MRYAIVLVSLGLLSSAVSAQENAPRPPAATLVRAQGASLPVDSRGFIHRWWVLEPAPVPGRLTEAAVEEALKLAALPAGATAPKAEGSIVAVNGAPLVWHALDTTLYDVNLYHFAWALSMPTSNVLFWVETTIDSPREMTHVRLAIGSNAASRWWVNDEAVIALNDDRQAVIDDGVSRRITLRQGRNVIRAAIINGGGATDFCARFLDENDRPVTGLRAAL